MKRRWNKIYTIYVYVQAYGKQLENIFNNVPIQLPYIFTFELMNYLEKNGQFIHNDSLLSTSFNPVEFEVYQVDGLAKLEEHCSKN